MDHRGCSAGAAIPLLDVSVVKPGQRSYLFVPANRPDRYAKALESGADAVIIDLEDAVPPGEKESARRSLGAWLAPAHRVLMRINGAGTEWFGDDLAVVASPGLAGLILPKAERIEDIAALLRAVGGLPILPLIETAKGFDNLQTLARAEGVERLVFGSIDFQADLGMRAEEAELLPFRTQLVLASRLAGIAAPVDGVSTAIDDHERLRADALHARRLGFGGKLCIHPRQVETINRCFMPTEEEIAWARAVIDADARSGGVAVAVDGRMVDRPVVLQAQAILREATGRGGATS